MLPAATEQFLPEPLPLRKVFLTCLVATLAVGCAAFRAYLFFATPSGGIDDSSIFFVYARNLAHGQGFVFNIGGERVEGFTSLLYVLVLSPFFLAAQHPEFYILLFNLLIVAAAVAYTMLFLDTGFLLRAERPFPHLSLPAALFVAWVLCSPAFVTWAVVSLMDVGLYTALLLFVVTRLLYGVHYGKSLELNSLLLPFLLPCLILTRPESIVWAPLFAAGHLLTSFVKRADPPVSFLRAWGPLFSSVLAILLLTAFRMIYFGYPLPNTYYAKVSPSLFYNIATGWEYWVGFATSNGIIVIQYLACIALLGHAVSTVLAGIRSGLRAADWRNDPAIGDSLGGALVSLTVVIGSLIPVLTGGDHLGSYRFFQPVWPLLFLALVYFFRVFNPLQVRVRLSAGRTCLAAVIGWLCLASSNTPRWSELWGTHLFHEFQTAEKGRAMGDIMGMVFRGYPLPTVGAISVGGLKYTYPGPVVDLMGLSNVEMGHSTGDRKGVKNHAAFSREVFYRQMPDIVCPTLYEQIGSLAPPDDDFLNAALRGVYKEDRFRERYTCAAIRRKGLDDAEWLGGYFRNDYLAGIRQNRQYEVGVAARR